MTSDETVVWVDDLDADVCWRLLARQSVGRVAFTDLLGPLVLPVNHHVDGRSIVFRTGATTLLEALAGGAPVSFEVDEADAYGQTGWSVLVRGQALEITDPVDRSEAEALPVHPWAPGARDHWIRIAPDTVSGRAISRQRADGHLLPYMPPD